MLCVYIVCTHKKTVSKKFLKPFVGVVARGGHDPPTS